MTEAETQVGCTSPPDNTCELCKDTDSCNGKKYKITMHNYKGTYSENSCTYSKDYEFDNVCPIGDRCVACTCREWDEPTRTYSNCYDTEEKRIKQNIRSGYYYTVQCKSDGKTPMPGGWTEHAKECHKISFPCTGTRLSDGFCCTSGAVASDGSCCASGVLSSDGSCFDCKRSRIVWEEDEPKECCSELQGDATDENKCPEVSWDDMFKAVDEKRYIKNDFTTKQLVSRVIREGTCGPAFKKLQGVTFDCENTAKYLGQDFGGNIRTSKFANGCIWSAKKARFYYNTKTTGQASSTRIGICMFEQFYCQTVYSGANCVHEENEEEEEENDAKVKYPVGGCQAYPTRAGLDSYYDFAVGGLCKDSLCENCLITDPVELGKCYSMATLGLGENDSPSWTFEECEDEDAF